jgi:hypothetical protein
VCLIVDTNAAHVFLAQGSGVLDWLLGGKGNPRLVAEGRLKAELVQIGEVRRLFVQLDRAGILRSGFDGLGDEEVRIRTSGNCRSNDVHVLALSIVSGARTLATFDEALTADFKDTNIISSPRGNVYRNPAVHSHLLRHTPRSCGVRAPKADRPRRGKRK